MRILKFVGMVILLLVLFAAGSLAARWVFQSSDASAVVASQYAPSAKEGRGSRALPTERVIQDLQSTLEKNPHNAENWALLGSAFLQRVREDADPANYARAEQAFQKALELDADNLHAVSGMGGLALARHRFQDAVCWGERGRQLNLDNAGIYGILGDAHLELGEYDAAFENFQKMVDTRPDLSSYARVSYARELLGDRAGAIETMLAAVNAGGIGSEARSWALVQLGNLYLDQARFDDARSAYQQSLQNWNDYPYARSGLARLYAMQGDYDQAVETYTRLIQAIPLPEFVIGLGDVYAAKGDTANAQKQYALVGAMQQLFQLNGVDTDAELALFQADHQLDLERTLALARRAYANRPSIVVADILAWTLYQNGAYDEARDMIERALRLGTRNALMFYHAGMIAYRRGDTSAARDFLGRALELNPRFSLLYADDAHKLLTELQAAGHK